MVGATEGERSSNTMGNPWCNTCGRAVEAVRNLLARPHKNVDENSANTYLLQLGSRADLAPFRHQMTVADHGSRRASCVDPEGELQRHPDPANVRVCIACLRGCVVL